MFNIITPTYNRSHLIHRVYESLINQTYKGFSWIVVDDGSDDDTEQLIETWRIETTDFDIEYYKLVQNVGKPEAVNFGLTKCKNLYTIIADSDDTFLPNTLSNLMQIWATINLSNHNIAAIWTLVLDEENKIKGDKFPKDWWQVNFNERVLKQKVQIHGDKWHCWVTEVLKDYPLYSAKGCHIGESHTWNRINSKYDYLCVNLSFLIAHETSNSLITSKKSNLMEAKSGYYSAFYGLKGVPISNIISNSYYRLLAFEYVKGKLYYQDSERKLSDSKFLVSVFIFLSKVPYRAYKKLL